MKKSLLFLCMAIFLNGCVELPDIFPNGEGEESDMLIFELDEPFISLTNQFPDTLSMNDSVQIFLTVVDEGAECSDMKLNIANGQILKELGNYTYYGGLSNGSLLGNATYGSWVNSYRITDRFSVSNECRNDHLFERNKDIYLGCRFKFSDNQWHYGWVVLHIYEDIFALDQFIYVRRVGINKSSGTNVRIGG